jgi:hypothetical protein
MPMGAQDVRAPNTPALIQPTEDRQLTTASRNRHPNTDVSDDANRNRGGCGSKIDAKTASPPRPAQT